MKSLIRILTKKKLKISFAESCTGGLLASNPPVQDSANEIFSFFLISIFIKDIIR